jgi:5-methylcytosine-specific restriction enzyme A
VIEPINMNLPPLTPNAVLDAMDVFDREIRGGAAWKAWTENNAHRYAIEHDGKLYPVKKIASIASGVPVRAFSGGREHANEILKRVGFKIVNLHLTNPDWLRDELILALNVYLKHRPNPPGKDTTEIRDLSALLNRLGEKLFSPEDRSDTFRNVNGVYMKLMNFRRLDPQYTAHGRIGLARGAKAEEEVWAEFADDPERCQEVSDAISATLDDPETEPAWIDPDVDEGIQDAPEGRLLTRKHVARERNRKLVQSKRKQVFKKQGRLACEACGFDFAACYGTRGDGFIECHHTKPVSSLVGGHRTHVNDLALVCANCHRIIHRTKPWLSIDELKAILQTS